MFSVQLYMKPLVIFWSTCSKSFPPIYTFLLKLLSEGLYGTSTPSQKGCYFYIVTVSKKLNSLSKISFFKEVEIVSCKWKDFCDISC